METNENKWSESVKKAVWKKGRINPDHSPEVLRWDLHDHAMMWSEYGRKDSKFGWGIGRIELTKEKNTGTGKKKEGNSGTAPGKTPEKNPGKDPEQNPGNLNNLYPVNLWYSGK